MSKLQKSIAQWVEERQRQAGYWNAAIKLRLANEIGELLAASGMNRADLAREVGHSRSYITQVLGGTKNLTIDSMCTFAAVYGLVPRIEFVRPGVFWCDVFYVGADYRGGQIAEDLFCDFGEQEDFLSVAIGTSNQLGDSLAGDVDWNWEKAA